MTAFIMDDQVRFLERPGCREASVFTPDRNALVVTTPSSFKKSRLFRLVSIGNAQWSGLYKRVEIQLHLPSRVVFHHLIPGLLFARIGSSPH